MPMSPDTCLLVWCNCPDGGVARQLADAALDARLVACANLQAPVTSLYCWEGRREEATEVPLLLKTTAARYPDLEALLRRLHPYSVPEILAWPASLGHPDYLSWVRSETQAAPALAKDSPQP